MATFSCYSDPLVTCPYNPAHRVAKSRMQLHITKCRQSLDSDNKKVCPFNAQHRIEPEKYESHILKCPDKVLLDRQVACSRDENVPFTGHISVPAYGISHHEPETSENWDEELADSAGKPAYDPRAADVKPLFRSVNGMKPAERREYYASLFSQPRDNIPNIDMSKEKPEGPEVEKEVLIELRKPATGPRLATVEPPVTNVSQSGIGRGEPVRHRIPVAERLMMGIGRGQQKPKETPTTSATNASISPSSTSLAGVGRGRGSVPPSPDNLPPLKSGVVKNV